MSKEEQIQGYAKVVLMGLCANPEFFFKDEDELSRMAWKQAESMYNVGVGRTK